ncbi:hypothetical protein RCH22_001592 [Cryobacterium psychrotolerans]|nr:hypothetical protein [Cryobacterium psychrotolerans]
MLATGQLVRTMPEPVAQAEGVGELIDPGLLRRIRPPPVESEWQGDVPPHVQRRDEVERLEDEADPAAAQDRQFRVAQAGDLGITQPNPAGACLVQSRHDVHQGGLARAARPHDRRELATTDADGHVVERRYRGGG